MSLRSVGNQLLQTASSSLLTGASTASLSLWIRVNPGHGVANANDVEIFGDSGGKISATLSGTGSLQLRWSSINGDSSGSSSCSLTLTPGTSYHLAAVWQSGVQRYYLNGVQVKLDNQVGSIGILGDANPRPYRLGSDSAGTDASLGEPTLWVGYALSAQDVLNLRNRTVQPSSIAPSSIALQWSLTGPDGIAAQVGDSGLADASPSGLNLSSVVGSPPIYQAAALTYSLPLLSIQAMASPTGESLAIVLRNSEGGRATWTTIQTGNEVQFITPRKAAVSGSMALTFGGQTTAPIAYAAADQSKQAVWTIPVASGVAHQISMTCPNADGYYSRNVVFDVIEDGLVRATATISQDLMGSGDFQTPDNQGHGSMSSWRLVFPSYTPTGSTIRVRMTAANPSNPPNQSIWVADGLHVKNLSTNVVAIHDDTDDAFSQIGADQIIDGGYFQYYSGSFRFFGQGSGAGTALSVDPAEFQAKFEALPNVGAGNTIVTAVGDGTIKVEFVNALKGAAQPLITSNNPAVVVSQTVGGFVPDYRIKPQGGSFGPWIGCRDKWIPITPNQSWLLYAFDDGPVFNATDEIEVRIPASTPPWVSGPNGPIQPGVYPVENRFGGTLVEPFVADQKTMKCGQGVQQDVYFGETLPFVDLAGRLDWPIKKGGLNDGPIKAIDANGWPTRLGNDSLLGLINVKTQFSGGVNGKGTKSLPNGLYTFYWKGPFDEVGFGARDTTLEGRPEYEIVSDGSGATKNRVVVNFQANPDLLYSPSFSLTLIARNGIGPDGFYAVSARDFQIYPPDPADPTGMTPWLDPPNVDNALGKFHPSFLRQLEGVKILRFMQSLSSITNAYAHFHQIKPDNYKNRISQTYIQRVGVASCSAYTGPPLDNPHIAMFKITTVTPHGMHNGSNVFLENCGTAVFSNGNGFTRTMVLSASGGDLGSGVVTVLDDYNLALHAFGARMSQGDTVPGLSNGDYVDGVAMTNVTTGGGINANIGSCTPLIDVVDLCNVMNAECWLNFPVTVTDACLTEIAEYVRDHLNPGLKIHLEWGNENWNFTYASNYWTRVQSFQLFGVVDDSYHRGHAHGQHRMHQRFEEVFSAAGRSSDLIYTYASQGGVEAVTGNILRFAAGQDPGTDAIGNPGRRLVSEGADVWRVDELAIAPYVNSYNPENFDTDRADEWSHGIHMDILEMQVQDPGYKYVRGHRDDIDEFYPNAKLVCYEGGPEMMAAGAKLGNEFLFDNLLTINHACHRNPRMYYVMLNFLQQLQDEGCSDYVNFYFSGGSSVAQWSAYQWYDQRNSVGDLSENPDPQALDSITSTVGGAIFTWNSLLGATTPGGGGGGTTSPPLRYLPVRNGGLLTRGLPRGLFRPTRAR